jgi:hypothetical protein
MDVGGGRLGVVPVTRKRAGLRGDDRRLGEPLRDGLGGVERGCERIGDGRGLLAGRDRRRRRLDRGARDRQRDPPAAPRGGHELLAQLVVGPSGGHAVEPGDRAGALLRDRAAHGREPVSLVLEPHDRALAAARRDPALAVRERDAGERDRAPLDTRHAGQPSAADSGAVQRTSASRACARSSATSRSSSGLPISRIML